jgi:glucose 1-dehydrogenase
LTLLRDGLTDDFCGEGMDIVVPWDWPRLSALRNRAPQGRGHPVRLQDKVAVVTGAGTGIGQAVALAFAQDGAAVVVDYVGSTSVSEDTIKKISAMGRKSLGVDGDISRPDDVNELIRKTVAAFGKLDIFVNNAGIEKKIAFVEYPLDEWQKIMAVNLTGPFLCSQAAAKQMIQQGKGGRIINISSIHEDLPMPTNAPYCASKGGLRMLMRTIAVELAPHQITVNNIGPGAIYTPIDRDVESDAKLNDQILAEIPMGRWGKPEEVAQLALYLASDDAAYVTGSTHFIDGGMLRNAGRL